MTELQIATVAEERPAPEGYPSWPDYWTAQGQPWRTMPEIDEERQRFLAERRAIIPDVEMGIYPFKDVALDRADIEWLLAMHESGGMRGPVDWSDEQQRTREGLDLRGADLRGRNLSRLPLARMRGGYVFSEAPDAPREQSHMAAAHLEAANLNSAHLEGAQLSRARLDGATLRAVHLESADLFAAHLEAADLNSAHLEGADLSRAFFDTAGSLYHATFGNAEYGGARLAGVRWGGADLAQVQWREVTMLGDERQARQRRTSAGKRKRRAARLAEYEDAVWANNQLAITLRDQGLSDRAARFFYHAHVLERQVLLRQGQPLRFLGALLLDLVAGYGYRPLRSFLTYAVVVLGFAATYYGLGNAHGQPLTWNEALVVSMTAFHGRGFFATVFQPSDPQAAVAAVEALVGLLIEITFIATFTQRFFAR